MNPDEIRENNLESAVEALTIKDRIYGYPITADNGYFLYYNKAYFSEEDIQDLDKILGIAAKNDKLFAMDWSSGWYLYSFFGQTDLVTYLNESILPDYEAFVTAGVEYRENASYIEQEMENFVKKTDRLNENFHEIAASIDSITRAIDEGVEGVNGTAVSMQTLAMEIDGVSGKMDENQEIAGSLKKETEIFVNL